MLIKLNLNEESLKIKSTDHKFKKIKLKNKVLDI